MIDGSVLQSAQKCFEKKSRVVVKMVVTKDSDSVDLAATKLTCICTYASFFPVFVRHLGTSLSRHESGKEVTGLRHDM